VQLFSVVQVVHSFLHIRHSVSFDLKYPYAQLFTHLMPMSKYRSIQLVQVFSELMQFLHGAWQATHIEKVMLLKYC
jgi:hypothetical protein